MNQTFCTIIHAAPKLNVDELSQVAKALSPLLDEQLVKEAHTNYSLINPVVAENIDFKRPEEGEVIYELVKLAKERNIDYTPSHSSQQTLAAYCLRKNIRCPIDLVDVAPQYQPQQNLGPPPVAPDFN